MPSAEPTPNTSLELLMPRTAPTPKILVGLPMPSAEPTPNTSLGLLLPRTAPTPKMPMGLPMPKTGLRQGSRWGRLCQ